MSHVSRSTRTECALGAGPIPVRLGWPVLLRTARARIHMLTTLYLDTGRALRRVWRGGRRIIDGAQEVLENHRRGDRVLSRFAARSTPRRAAARRSPAASASAGTVLVRHRRSRGCRREALVPKHDGTMRADDSAARAVARSHLREKPKDERALRPGRARRPFKRPSDDERARARLSARRRELCAGLRLRAASDRAEWPHCGEPERRVRANREANAARRDVEREQRHGRAAQPLREGCGREQPRRRHSRVWWR